MNEKRKKTKKARQCRMGVPNKFYTLQNSVKFRAMERAAA
tara:strand:- start:12442 stop:12561 length:120 start_codon:yes stop_codon:yes gene_type:complete